MSKMFRSPNYPGDAVAFPFSVGDVVTCIDGHTSDLKLPELTWHGVYTIKRIEAVRYPSGFSHLVVSFGVWLAEQPSREPYMATRFRRLPVHRLLWSRIRACLSW